MIFQDQIKDMQEFEEMRPLFGTQSKLSANKVIHELDFHAKEFISKSPFLVMSTSDSKGRCDVSPRGDAPGFVQIIDNKHLFIPERPGNRRMDSIINILNNPQIGLIFLIPGMGETFRVNGRACVSRDKALLEKSAVNGREPLLGIGVQVEECYIHCAKAIKRSGLWDAETWLQECERPSAVKMLAAHVCAKTKVTEEEVGHLLEESYVKRLY
ncbi:pyridoxamine 5'-phosphate oxidase family protein [Bacillus sp. T33-2]|uniref:pyridoxamine 5'-phosphate oxidase family protein n=1 Tax=Bacillus sp. T33-2 TaxID=2054168 RepID=UPI000C7718EA|nr:pyridoxamine 5'-phosphate oxidase family protein [Bacillus sp. T33-2]PLR95137.1 phosphohydrolase [Bacillus sp. T33-2]